MTSRLPSSESIEPAFFALRELFTGPLRGVSFPGVDASTVAGLVDEAQRRLEQVAAARSAFADAHRELIAAESSLSEQQTILLGKSHVALAYARVFAQDDPELFESIDRIVLPKPRAGATASQTQQTTGSPGAKRRGRPPKSSKQGATAPNDGGQVALPASAAGAEEVAAE